MKITSEFTFFKAQSGEKKNDKKETIGEWVRVTLVDEDHEIFEVFGAKDSAHEIAKSCALINYGEKVLATFEVRPNFKKDGYVMSLKEIANV
ncbi:MAG: hypothetical protein K5768_04080 [Firmicutes bacterium]|nr:hypothetical protein [Bacillota bacterium]